VPRRPGSYHPITMGQPITAIRTESSRHDTLRFDINRNLTGMDHERYVVGQPIEENRPPDRLARALFEHGGVLSVHIYGNVITIHHERDADVSGLQEIIENLYIYYRPGVEVVVPEGVAEG
jgi:hypothetical protein